MRILLFIDSLGPGGAQRQLVGLACMLKNKNNQVKVIVYHDIPFYKSLLDEKNIEYEYIESAHNKLYRFYFIHKAVKKFNPDWLISYLDTPCILSCFNKLLFKDNYKLLVSERNTTQHLTLKERLKFLLYKSSDFIVPNAYSQGVFITENFPSLKEKVKVINNFVDIQHFSFKKNRVRSKIPEIAIVATIWPSKNTLGFIDAVKLLHDKGVQCKFNWYGKVPDYKDYIDKCERKILDYGLSDYIILHDKTNKIKDVYFSADYFCLPSFYEGTPNVIGEAMSSGLPIVCSNVCDNGRYVTDGLNGYLFNPKDYVDMANKICSLLSLSESEYTKMSQKSREIAENLLSESQFIDKYLKILN